MKKSKGLRKPRRSGGALEVIVGCMFSGKTDELVRRLELALIAGQSVQVFKPAIDHRYSIREVVSHAGRRFSARPVKEASRILSLLDDKTSLVAIDEAQFFDETIVEVVESLVSRRIRVIVTGLDLDFRGEPFGPMPILMAKSSQLQKLQAVCEVCGELTACRTQRLIRGRPAHYDAPVVFVGGRESYRARCLNHHVVPGRPRRRSKEVRR